MKNPIVNMWYEVGEILPEDEGTMTVFSDEKKEVCEKWIKENKGNYFIDKWKYNEKTEENEPCDEENNV